MPVHLLTRNRNTTVFNDTVPGANMQTALATALASKTVTDILLFDDDATKPLADRLVVVIVAKLGAEP